ncbi:MAG: 50S ribosomal protein L18 [Alphaproteobacteria bacterium]
MARTKQTSFKVRRERVRGELGSRFGVKRPRLSVFRSGLNIYAQVIDDKAGRTVAAASSVEKEVKTKLKTGADRNAATEVGKIIAERALKAGVKEVMFDRGGYRYHGRIKALADAAREAGLSF